ncbi:MAG: DegV family EDD domain-containing protein [Chloroflexi bacterium]|nr:DegV family EDD domain-containing protein [Chloroflexota bacterium]
MPRLVLVTDSSADVPAAVLAEGGVVVVAANTAFQEHSFTEGDLKPAEFYARMVREAKAPRPSGVSEKGWRAAFDAVLAAGDTPVALVTPFDVLASFTTCVAAALSYEGAADIKVLNPGVASAGLASLVASLAAGIRSGWDRQTVLDKVDELGPLCDTLFVPEDITWLNNAGKLTLVEQKLGQIDEQIPVLRVATRLTGVALEQLHGRAIIRAVTLAGARGGSDRPLNVTVLHANAEARAHDVAARMRERWDVARLCVAPLSMTIGSQVGPGAIGIGVAPAVEG